MQGLQERSCLKSSRDMAVHWLRTWVIWSMQAQVSLSLLGNIRQNTDSRCFTSHFRSLYAAISLVR